MKLYFIDVLTRPLRIPKSLSVEAASVLMGFLNKNPSYRLGCDENNGFCGVKHHLFFKSVDWEMVNHIHNFLFQILYIATTLIKCN